MIYKKIQFPNGELKKGSKGIFDDGDHVIPAEEYINDDFSDRQTIKIIQKYKKGDNGKMEKKGINVEILKSKEKANKGERSNVKYAPKTLKKDGKKEKEKEKE